MRERYGHARCLHDHGIGGRREMSRGCGCGCGWCGGNGRPRLRRSKWRGRVGECLLRREGRGGDEGRGCGEGGAGGHEGGSGDEGGERREVHRGGALRHGVVLAERGEDGRREGRRARGVRCRRRGRCCARRARRRGSLGRGSRRVWGWGGAGALSERRRGSRGRRDDDGWRRRRHGCHRKRVLS